MTILGIRYQVKQVGQSGLPDEHFSGFINYERNEILILETLPMVKQWEIFLHEMSHGILAFFSLWDIKPKMRERVCDAFSRALPMIEFEEDAA